MIRIEDKANCCGCGACAARCPKSCIRLLPDQEGFLYPEVDMTACVDCGRCEDVCPELNVGAARKPLKAMAAVCQDEALRLQSSSGGIFSLLAEAVLARGGVVFGARFDEQWQVVLDHTETLEGLAAFRGSKYVQAKVGRAYADCAAFLRSGREVLFSGTPCQIAGLKGLLGCDYPNLTLVDVACVGVPSPGLWQSYLRCESRAALPGASADAALAALREVRFRDKSKGWKDSRMVLRWAVDAQAAPAIAGENPDGWVEHSAPRYKNPFFQALNTGLVARPSCYACQLKGEGRSGSDLTLADCWGVDQLLSAMTGQPDAEAARVRLCDDKGSSLVIVRSSRGEALLQSLPMIALDCDYEAAVHLNAGLRAASHQPPHAGLRAASHRPPHAGLRAGAPSSTAREAFFKAYQADSTQVSALLKKAVTPPLYQKILNKLRSL